jgi:TetR/AcrR family transcriptional regulator, cholesterol catabolism regulator
VPRNRRSVDRGQREGQLLDAAEGRFLTAGFEATTMKQVAADAGVTANTIYWYFPTKEHLLLAVLDRWIDTAAAVIDRQPARPEPVAALVVAILREAAPLLGVIHQRARRSAAVAEFHGRFHRRLRAVLARGLAPAYPSCPDAALAADVLVAAVEGALEHDGPGQKDVIDAAVRAGVGGRLAG